MDPSRAARLAYRASFWEPRSYSVKDPYYDVFPILAVILQEPTISFTPLKIPFSFASGFLGSSFALRESIAFATDKITLSNVLYEETVAPTVTAAINSSDFTGLSSFQNLYGSFGASAPSVNRCDLYLNFYII